MIGKQPSKFPLTKDSEDFQAHVRKMRRNVKEAREENHKKSRKFIKVDAYERGVGRRLGGQMRKDAKWNEIFTLCSMTDVEGVTIKDKELARIYIGILEDTFLTDRRKSKKAKKALV